MTTLLVMATDSTGNTTRTTVDFSQGSPQAVGKLHAVYYMCWSNSGSPLFSALPSKYNEVRLAFVQTQGGHLKLVGYGSQDLPTLKAGIAKFRASGKRVLLSIGGSQGAADVSNVAQCVADLIAIDVLLGGVDGIDWDVEASALNGTNVLAINKGVVALRPDWFISFVPNGGNVDQYLPAAVAAHRAGLKVLYGQQFYDAVVSRGAARDRIDQAIKAGLPADRIYVAMMNWLSGASSFGPDHYWDTGTCVANMQAFLAEWPTLAGAAYWEAGRAKTPDNASYPDRMGTVLGILL